jgi:signal peptidase II
MNNQIYKKHLKFIAIILMIAIFFIADRYLKYVAIYNFKESSYNLLGNFLTFTFVPNYYIAFSLPLSGLLLNIVIGLMIISIFVYLINYLRKQPNTLFFIGMLLILLGAISNFSDRILYGYVIDYIYLKHFTVFNFADAYITIGAILTIISLNKKTELK